MVAITESEILIVFKTYDLKYLSNDNHVYHGKQTFTTWTGSYHS